MDTFMPRMNGLVAAKSLCQEMRGIKVLMHSVHTGREYMLQIIRSGAVGFVPKDAPMSEILEAIERAHRGETYFNTVAARAACEEHQRDAQLHSHEMNSSLSCRELEVLSKIAEGGSTREIAAQMGIGVRTVETHRERIMDKLQIRSVAGLTRFAILCGIATIDSNPRKTETEASNLAVQSA
jgi:DNA-binding NarL/FixJ family response regulator